MFDPDFPDKFTLFTTSHVVTMALIAVMWVALPLWFRRFKDKKPDAVLRYALAGLLVAQYLGWMLWEALTGRFTVQLSLPLNLCDLSVFLLAVLLVSRSYLLYEVLYFWALAGTLQSFVTPNITYAFPHFEFFAFYIQHGGEILAIVYLSVVARMRPRPISILKSLGALLVWLVVVYVFNLLTDSNYMFLMADTPHPSTVTKMIAIFGEPPRHLIGLGMVVAVSLLVLYTPFAIKDLVARVRRRSGESS